MNNASGTTGKKEHMFTTTIYWVESKNGVIAKTTGTNTECNKHIQLVNSFNDFRKVYKNNPDICCKKCVDVMNRKLNHAKMLLAKKQS
jgi:hypothetical protein